MYTHIITYRHETRVLLLSFTAALLPVWFSWQHSAVYRLCYGFQFALQFVTFILLLQHACHSVDCQLYYQFGSAGITVLYSDCVVDFRFHYTFEHLTCCDIMSVIQFAVSCTLIHFAEVYGCTGQVKAITIILCGCHLSFKFTRENLD